MQAPRESFSEWGEEQSKPRDDCGGGEQADGHLETGPLEITHFFIPFLGW